MIPNRSLAYPVQACLKRTLPVLGLVMGLVLMTGCASQSRFAEFQQQAEQRYGGKAAETTRELVTLMDALLEKEADTDTKLNSINQFFNQKIAFKDDTVIWGESDYWASPLETIAKGAGDCEDFVIAKFAMLRLLDIPLADLRLTYVRLKIGGPTSRVSQAHMVLSYYQTSDAEPQVLDNIIKDIRPASARPDLTPLFSFNNQSLWAGDNSKATRYKPQDHLSRWEKTLQKMAAEGL